MVATEKGVIKVMSYKRRPEEQRWNKEEFEGIKGLPWEPVPGRAGIEIKSRVEVPTERAPVTLDEGILLRPKVGRRMYITKDDVDRMGMTPGCRGCIAATRGEAPKNHSEECRTRMETAVSAYDEERFEKALNR